MRALSRLLRSPRWGGLVLAAFTAASGCDAILGIKDVSLDPTGSSSTGSGGMGGSTSSSSSSSQGGTGGAMQGDFELTIGALSVDVPLDGHTTLGVEIVPSGGFAGAVDVDEQSAVAGIDVVGTQIPAGSTTGVITVGATSPLTVGQTFKLKLKGTSGTLVHTAEVDAKVTGKPGTLDGSFGTGGVTTWPVSVGYGTLASIRWVPPGKILVAGNMETTHTFTMMGARLGGDGGLDTSFKQTGTVTATFCSCGQFYPEHTVGAFWSPPGEIALVGEAARNDTITTPYDIAIARFNDDGTPKPVFNDGGLRLIDLGEGVPGEGVNEKVYAAAMTASNQLVVLGRKGPNPAPMFVTRLDAGKTGTDPLFGQNGYVTLPARQPVAVLVDGQKRIVVVSESMGTLYIDRLTEDGQPEASKEYDTSTAGYPVSAALRSDGGVIVLTSMAISAFGLWRLEPDLTLSAQPNPEVYDPTPDTDEPRALAVLPDGRILVAGTHNTAGSFLARILPDGMFDPTFGDNASGWADVSLGAATQLRVMTVAPDGKILVGGTAGSPPEFAVGRVWN